MKKIIKILGLLITIIIVIIVIYMYFTNTLCVFYSPNGYIKSFFSVKYSYKVPGAGSGEYRCGKKNIEEADKKSFEIIDKFEFAKDDEYVYCRGAIANARNLNTGERNYLDPKSFEIIDSGVIKDKDYIYTVTPVPQSISCHIYTKSKNADNFECLTDKYLGKNGNGFCSYIRDGNEIYFLTEKIEGADSDTFEVIESSCDENKCWYAKDKLHVYKDGVVMTDLNPETFTNE